MQKIIGLYSPAPQSGKSTIARELEKRGYTVVPFAETLKLMLIPMLESLGYDEHGANYLVHQAKQVVVGDAGVSVRHMLQTLGTEWGRQCIHPDIWVRCWKGRAQRFDAVVADDVRFPNEAKMIKLLGGEMWRIDRPDAVRTFDHASEGSLDTYHEFDRHITNEGTIDELISKLQDIPV
jgi:hypothetical protein